MTLWTFGRFSAANKHAARACCLMVISGLAFPAYSGQDVDPSKPMPERDLTALPLEELLNVTVTSASLHEQRIKDAPASVTVISADEIRKSGYRTLAEALAYVRGFYTSTDHTYTYLGVRGFSLPGDYDTRVIVMINGHSIADNIFDQSTWFGNDFPVDIDLVDRIEVLRGSSSSLYGSNGMLATINIVTKRPEAFQGSSARIETDSLGARKIEGATSLSLPRGANLLFSTSIFNNRGAQELYFSELDSPENNFGRAIRMDGEKGYHAFLNLTWGHWEVLAVAGDRVKQQPITWGDAVFNDRATSAEDSRGFIDVSYTKKYSGDRTLSWRTSYDAYRYRGIYHYHYSDSTVEDSREHDYGDWVGSTVTYRLPDYGSGYITVGAEGRFDLRALQNAFDVQPEPVPFLRVNRRDRYAGFFAQQEWAFGKHWEANLGARFDWSLLKRSAASPRLALIYKPTSSTDIKMLYSRGFRNPSSYDMFYADNGLTQLANTSLRPETTDTFEVDVDREFTKRISAAASVYHYRVSDLIQQIFTSAGPLQYVNEDHVRAAGASVELAFHFSGFDLASSIEFQRAVLDDGTVLPNSPGQVGKLRASVPLWRNRLRFSGGIQALGQRNTYDREAMPWVILPDAVVTTRPLAGGVQISMGARNLSNSFYRDPVGLSEAVDSMIGAGRTYYLNLSWHSPARQGEVDSAKNHVKPSRGGF
jgi:outer membrane receptor for ferrienterochelin and colicins